MKNLLIKIAVGVLMIFGGWQVALYGDKFTSQENLDNLRSFCDNAMTTTGTVRTEYKETTMKIGKLPVKMYEFTYDFEVGEKKYEAKTTVNIEKTPPTVTVWYDKNRPTINAVDDPCLDFKRTAGNKKVGSSTFYYIAGGLSILIGFGLAWGSIKGAIVDAVKKSRNK